MQSILISSILLSVLHALIPNHWLPIVAIGRKEKWTEQKTLFITLMAGGAHVLSTVLLGVAMGLAGGALYQNISAISYWAAPVVFIATGAYFLYKNQQHAHFHLNQVGSGWNLPWSLFLAMFFSPCLEIEVLFLAAGQYGAGFWLLVAGSYMLITVLGMSLWIWLVMRGLKKLDWHALEHNAGTIAGITLIATGLLMLV